MTEIATYEHHFITNDGPIFNMIEDESGEIYWGYGHRDPGEFVAEVMRWLQHVGAGPEPGEPHPSGLMEHGVEHLWASLEDPYGERFKLVPACNDPEVFPVTRLML